LVNYLHEQKRYGESITLLQALVAGQPEFLAYRRQLLHAYFQTGRHAELLALLEQTDTFFHQKNRWGEGVLHTLAESCLEDHLYARSVAYSLGLIALRKRTSPRRGIGDGTLSGYCTTLALAYSGRHKTAEAVGAAGEAIVSWGPDRRNRDQALETLKKVLQDARDLDAYVAQLDKQEKQNPVVRKALGQVYLANKQYAKAIAQLQLAAELQPNDAEIYQGLVACYDKQGDKDGAVRQLLQSAELSRRDITLFAELGRRYDALRQPREGERAYTSIVEVLTSESESHALLADIRQKQNRWPEAVAQWEEVARIRALEPEGLLKLAAAHIHENGWDQASQSLRKLAAKSWPARFGDVQQQVRQMELQMEKMRKK
jgi:tetratricopeptide (TPR) repeat protein